jgi:Tfp pilus assembly protein PilO
LPVWVALVLILALLGALGWQALMMKRAESRLETERQTLGAQFEADRGALLNDVRAKADANADETKRQFGMVLAWAVRGEMLRNNLDQVDQYFSQIIKLPHTELALLADSSGKVRVSTDRRHLGAALTTLVPVEATLQQAVSVQRAADEARLLVIPIMGLNSRLGTVVVRYRQPDVLGG